MTGSAENPATEALQRLIVRQDTLDCLLRYARGIDRRDWDLVLSAFHPDAIEKHGPFCGSPSEFVEWISEHTAGRESQQHLIGNHLVDIEGDVVHAETYFLAGQHRELEALLTEGRYVCRFEHRNDAWKIAEREVIVNWQGLIPLRSREGGLAQFTEGRYDESDASYLRPLDLRTRTRTDS